MRRPAPMVPILAALGLWTIPLVTPAPGEEPAGKVIPAAEAKSHLDERCVVEMTVRLSKHIPDKVDFLDSEADYHDPKNVAVVIEHKHAEAFQKAGIDDPSQYYKGKTIRVTGTLIFQSNQVRILVDDPKQIAVVEKKG